MTWNLDGVRYNSKTFRLAREAMAKVMSDRVITSDTKTLISKNHADVNGKNNPRFGTTWSDETRAKIIAKLTGRKLSDEHKANMSKGIKGKKRASRKRKNLNGNN